MADIQTNKEVWDNTYDWEKEGQEWGEEWSLPWGNSHSQWLSTLYPRLCNFLPADNILEIGPGYGRWSRFLIPLAKEYRGVDLAGKCIDHCKKRFAADSHAHFYQNDGLSLEMISDDSVDLCFSVDVLVQAEIDVMESYIRQIIKKLTKNGVAFLHHSNFQMYAELGLSNEQWRAESVSAGLVAEIITGCGGKVLVQEKMNWLGPAEVLSDCFTVFCRNDAAMAALKPILFTNRSFDQEAGYCKQIIYQYDQLSTSARRKTEDPIQEQPQNKTVVFLHIPKAGGTTLGQILYDQYGKNLYEFSVKLTEDYEKIKNMTPEEKRKIRCLWGHLFYGVHELLSQESTYFTLLRDPVARIISHYHYIFRKPDHYLRERVKEKNLSLLEYVTSKVTPELDNDQTRRIAGVNWHSEVTKEVFELAKTNLKNHFALVGVMERFDESLFLLSKIFDWQKTFYLPLNTGDKPSKQESYGDDVIAAITKRNQYDIELHRMAQERMDEQISRFTPAMKEELQDFLERHQRMKVKCKSVQKLWHGIGDKSLIIFAAGTHTELLLKYIEFHPPNLLGIVDSGVAPGRVRDFYSNTKVYDPSVIKKMKPDVVVISSFESQNEIKRFLLNELHYEGEIITFYDENDTKPFYL